jgi:hypothetical protein
MNAALSVVMRRGTKTREADDQVRVGQGEFTKKGVGAC